MSVKDLYSNMEDCLALQNSPTLAEREFDVIDVEECKVRFDWGSVDFMYVELLARFGCTDAEIAWEIGCTPTTFHRQKQRDLKLKYAVEAGKAHMYRALRWAQYKKAVVERNSTMLMWLGKNELGQADKQEIDTRGGTAAVQVLVIGDKEIKF